MKVSARNEQYIKSYTKKGQGRCSQLWYGKQIQKLALLPASSQVIFDFQGVLSTGADQNASGCIWIGLQPIRVMKSDVALI